MPDNRCVECQESPCACDLEAPCLHGVPRLFLGDCKPCSEAKHERYLRADGWCPASERDEARAACKRLADVARRENRKRWDREWERDQARGEVERMGRDLDSAYADHAQARREREEALERIRTVQVEGGWTDEEVLILLRDEARAEVVRLKALIVSHTVTLRAAAANGGRLEMLADDLYARAAGHASPTP